MQLLSLRKPYEMLPPVPEAQMLTHGFAYQDGTGVRDIGLEDIDRVLQQRVGLGPIWEDCYASTCRASGPYSATRASISLCVARCAAFSTSRISF